VTGWRDKAELKSRVMEWAAKLDVKVRGLYVRPMRNKWASCSTAGTLSLNDELLGMARDLGDYVIVHELLHLRVPNHGRLWKSLMGAYLGDSERQKRRLQSESSRHRVRRPRLTGSLCRERGARSDEC